MTNKDINRNSRKNSANRSTGRMSPTINSKLKKKIDSTERMLSPQDNIKHRSTILMSSESAYKKPTLKEVLALTNQYSKGFMDKNVSSTKN